MNTMLLERENGTLYLVERANIARPGSDLAAELNEEWKISSRASPFITWIASNFVQSGVPNSNTQYWTADDLDKGEASIRYSPMNMIHKFRTPIGFWADTRRITSKASLSVVDDASDLGAEIAGDNVVDLSAAKKDFTIQVLGGLWSHVFPFETALVEKADEEGTLFTSMECRGTHLSCEGPNGCGKVFEYMAESVCEHLEQRTSIRHIVNPTFRGGALIVPPVRPGWKGASATILEDAVMQEAAALAEQNEAAMSAYQAEGSQLNAASFEQLMALLISMETASPIQ